MNLNWLILIPLLTAVLIVLTRPFVLVRSIALGGALLQLLLSLALVGFYKKTGTTQAFEQDVVLYPDWNIHYHVAVDGIAVAMILLTSFVVVAGVLMSWKQQHRMKEYFLLLILLGLGAYGFFISQDLLIAFFFLEVAVIPKYLLISIWGSGKKVYSANKLALMLMGGSALILLGLFILYFAGFNRSFDMQFLAQHPIGIETQRIVFPLLFLGFGVFSALFPFHTWVPDGHSSAPTAGSMFLAGISMKLGGYGCLKVATVLLPAAAQEYSTWIIALSAIGILYGSFATLMQTDLKYMNAYSSISHCGFVLLGIGMLTPASINGAVMQMVSHGVMTALFFAVIGMIYERTHTRTIGEMGGLMKVMPFITTVFFMVGLCSLGLPGMSGFVAEMAMFVGSWERTGWLPRTATIAAAASIVVTAVYILRAIGKVAMGPLKEGMGELTDARWYEKAAAILMLLAILAIGLLPGWLMNLIDPVG